MSLPVGDCDRGKSWIRDYGGITRINNCDDELLVRRKGLGSSICGVCDSIGEAYCVSANFVFCRRVNGYDLRVGIYCNRCTAWYCPSKRVLNSISARRLLSIDRAEKTDFF